jgi:hypothetical protein
MGTSHLCSLLLLSLAVSSCSRSSSSDDPSPNSADAGGEFATYSVRMAEIHLGLRGAASFTMAVEGCASGYSSSVTETSSSIAVYKYDTGCLAKLTSVTLDGVEYTPSADQSFQTWLAGDTARFDDVSGSGKSVKFQVLNQLDSPIPGTAPTHGVEYAYSTIEQGADQDCTGDCIGNNYSATVSGVAAPGFDVSAFMYVDMMSDGSGMFQFKLQCQEDLVGTGADANCKSAPLSGLRYKLVQDTFNGVITAAEAASLIQSGAESIDAGEVIDAGTDSSMSFGGFATKVLKGPASLHLNPNMIFILETGATSYKFWNVDVQTLIQP